MNPLFFAPRLPRTLVLLCALGVPLLALAGCGGGSSGPSNNSGGATTGGTTTGGTTGTTTGGTTPTSTPTSTVPTPTPTSVPTPTSSGGQAVLFSDDFDAPNFDTATYGLYTNEQQLQRTQFGAAPTNQSEAGTTFTRLKLDSYNPDAPGQLFRGTELYTYRSFAVGQGLEAEARLRAPGLPPGLILAFFLINDRYEGAPVAQNYRKDEIDFEILTAQQQQIAGNTRNYLYTNVWNDWNEGLYGFDLNSANNGPERTNDDKVYRASMDPSLDYANWNVYRIRWYPDRTEFYVNDRLERIETEVRPDNPLSLHLNFWTPYGNFNQAFSGSLPGPVSSPDSPSRRIYQYDVDYVRVTALGAGANAARIAPASEAAHPVPGNLKSWRNG